eukprot:2606326-Prorocentrum_lima.AAC.1
MTSSLVGSEMCIRDRPGNVRQTFPALERAQQSKSVSGCNLNATPVFFFPVSYTHLTLPTICSV